MKAVLVIAVAIFLASFSLLLIWRTNPKPPAVVPTALPPPAASGPLKPDDLVSDLVFPDFRFTDQNNEPVTQKDFLGRLTVIDFIFTNCPFGCPMMTTRMSNLAKTFAGEPRVQLLSITVDPGNDTPDKLLEYATAQGANPKQWRFLYGSRPDVWGLLENDLKFGIEERPEQPIHLASGVIMNNIRHPTWLGLVGPDGRLLGIYQTDGPEALQHLENLKTRLRDGLAAMPKSK